MPLKIRIGLPPFAIQGDQDFLRRQSSTAISRLCPLAPNVIQYCLDNVVSPPVGEANGHKARCYSLN